MRKFAQMMTTIINEGLLFNIIMFYYVEFQGKSKQIAGYTTYSNYRRQDRQVVKFLEIALELETKDMDKLIEMSRQHLRKKQAEFEKKVVRQNQAFYRRQEKWMITHFGKNYQTILHTCKLCGEVHKHPNLTIKFNVVEDDKGFHLECRGGCPSVYDDEEMPY